MADTKDKKDTKKTNFILKSWNTLIQTPFFLISKFLTWPITKVIAYDYKKKEEQDTSQKIKKVIIVLGSFLGGILFLANFLMSLPIAIVGSFFNLFDRFNSYANFLKKDDSNKAKKAIRYFFKFLSNTIFLPLRIVNFLLIKPIVVGAGFGYAHNIKFNISEKLSDDILEKQSKIKRLLFKVDPAAAVAFRGIQKHIMSESHQIFEKAKNTSPLYYEVENDNSYFTDLILQEKIERLVGKTGDMFNFIEPLDPEKDNPFTSKSMKKELDAYDYNNRHSSNSSSESFPALINQVRQILEEQDIKLINSRDSRNSRNSIESSHSSSSSNNSYILKLLNDALKHKSQNIMR